MAVCGGPGTGYVNGDMNTYGRVYMNTNTAGRGSVYGKIDPDGDTLLGVGLLAVLAGWRRAAGPRLT